MRQRFRPPVGVISTGPNGQQIIVQQGQTIIQHPQYAGNVRMQIIGGQQQVVKTNEGMRLTDVVTHLEPSMKQHMQSTNSTIPQSCTFAKNCFCFLPVVL